LKLPPFVIVHVPQRILRALRAFLAIFAVSQKACNREGRKELAKNKKESRKGESSAHARLYSME